MKNWVLGLLFLLTLSSCSFFTIHRVPLEQGNIITQAQISRLHRGMSEGEVKRILGNAVLVNIFNKNQVNYVYIYKLGNQPKIEKQLLLTFRYGILQNIRY